MERYHKHHGHYVLPVYEWLASTELIHAAHRRDGATVAVRQGDEVRPQRHRAVLRRAPTGNIVIFAADVLSVEFWLLTMYLNYGVL